jgi:hypothetical protein
MPEHYTKNTLECTAYCGKCQRMTQHRVDGGRRGPCLECIGFVIGNCHFPAQPKCMHCDRPFPETAKIDAASSFHAVLLICPRCGLLTPFEYDREAGMTKAQQQRRRKAEKQRQNPSLFE